MTPLTVSITKVPPHGLILLRWICKLIGARIIVCRKRKDFSIPAPEQK